MRNLQPLTAKCQRCGRRYLSAGLLLVQTDLGLRWHCFDCRQLKLRIYSGKMPPPR